jgi:Tfp pilus assembly protein FimV
VPAAVQAEAPAQVQTADSDRVHVVRSGESLWSIAEDLLGPGASTEEVARAVDRLWGLNAERIGSGDPNVIMSGQRLAVPRGL